MIIEFGEWLPDQPEFNSAGCAVATNVYPKAKGYEPAKPPGSAVANAPPSSSAGLEQQRIRGAYWTADYAGQDRIFTGDKQDLFEVDVSAGTSSVVSSTAGAYSVKTDSFWEFETFENTVIAAPGAATSVALQKNDLAATSQFTAIAGAPSAEHIAVIGDFVVVGNTWDSVDGVVPHRVRWSAIGDCASWTVSAVTQADYSDLPGGPVQKIIGGEYGVVIQTDAISRLSYSGSPIVFQIDRIMDGIGTPSPQSAVKYGSNIFFLSHDGFRVISNGSSVQKIGAEKIDRWFWDNVELDQLYRVCGTLDQQNSRILWAFITSGSALAEPTRILSYAFDVNRWSLLEIDSHFLTYGIARTGAVKPEAIVFDHDHAMKPLIDNLGSNLTPTLETKFVEPNPGGHIVLDRVTPLTERSSAPSVDSVIKAITRRDIGEAADTAESTDTLTLHSPSGTYSGRASGRFLKLSLTESGAASNVVTYTGLEVDTIATTGRR